MAAKKKLKAKKTAKREKKERRFTPDATRSSRISVGAGMLGALALGAGVYGQFIRDPQLAYGQYLVAGGALVLGAALWFSDSGAHPVRVGDVGVAIERGTELTRLPWCDMESVRIDRGKLLLQSKDVTLSVPLEPHRVAASWILRELVSRMPDAMDVKQTEVDALPVPKENDGELVKLENVQIAGRHCASSDEP